MPETVMKEQNWVEQVWLDCLQESLAGSLGVHCQLQTSPEPASNAELLWWEQKFSIAPAAMLWTGAGQEAWSQIGHLALRAAGVEDSDTASRRETYLEVVSHALSSLAERASQRCGRDVTCERGREASPGSDAEVLTVTVTLGDGPALPLYTAFDPSFLDALSEMQWHQQDEVALEVPAAGETPQPGGAGVYNLLLDVELPVSISFGQAILQLKEVLKLTSGSIVELNRGVSEPVDVFVNNCIVARGDVVVVDGNYGVRIREIVSRQEPLRKLD